MTYVVTENCIKCKYMDCVEVCPVDCFYVGENMLVIHPDECIDCGVCEPECPAEAILPDSDDKAAEWLEQNRQYAALWPNTTRKMFDEALAVLKGRARIKRTMWSRRAQEYEAKINSGDPIAIAEVVRDLHRNSGQPDQSFSERQIYEAAMDRLAAELGALDETDKMTATIKLINFLKAA